MTKKHNFYGSKPQPVPPEGSLLDHMSDGNEFESLVKLPPQNVNLVNDLLRSIQEIESCRGKKVICYLANIVNQTIQVSTSIDYNDDLPFSEMITRIHPDVKDVDIVLVTPGGSAQQVAKFVDKLRPRFQNVSFILPNMAMSAGTIFAMSGDEIIMGPNAYIGPIDPQVTNKYGQYVPAQALLTLIEEIQKRGDENISKGLNPQWSDIHILNQMDAKEIGNALSASKYSINLVKNFLYNYKFKTWETHSKDGRPVTHEDKRRKAEEIATHLCDHKEWKTHSRGITRDVAWNECRIKITHTEDIDGLDKAIRRFWALVYWIFENTSIAKGFVSSNYCILRNDPNLIKE